MTAPARREVTLQNCRLRNPCPKPWDGMVPVNGNASIRFCDECQKRVHLCRTDKELARHVRQGDCVAFVRSGAQVEPEPAARAMWTVGVVDEF